MALEETPGRSDPQLNSDFLDIRLTCRFEPDSGINLPRRSTGSAQLSVVVQVTGQAPRTFRYARLQPWFDLAPCRYRTAAR